MKVRLSYAVELDEVPMKTQEMIKQLEYELSLQRDALSKAALIVTEEKCISASADMLDDVRKTLSEIDQGIADVYSILTGYVNVLKEQSAPKPTQEAPSATTAQPAPPFPVERSKGNDEENDVFEG
tara:strand:- start:644 stop:1021 length:378 start_codon:yes stop_codon:yes gene_type:complete